MANDWFIIHQSLCENKRQKTPGRRGEWTKSSGHFYGRLRAVQGIRGLSYTGGYGRFRGEWVNDDEFSLTTSALNVGCMYFVTYIPTDVTGQRVQGSADLKNGDEVGERHHARRGGGAFAGYATPEYHKKNWQIPKYRVKNQQNTDAAYIFGHAY